MGRNELADFSARRTTGLAVLCDFDGTITLIDTAEYILQKFADGDWRAPDGLLEKGEISIEECMRRQFKTVSISRERMVQELDGVVLPRPGFPQLLDLCRDNGHRFRITSAGFDFFIRHFMRAHGWEDRVEVIAPVVSGSGDGVRFDFPLRSEPTARNFKEDHVLRERRAGLAVAYIGDGTSDLWAALSGDLAFAVRGSKLDRLLEHLGRAHHAFEDFQEVIDVLDGR